MLNWYLNAVKYYISSTDAKSNTLHVWRFYSSPICSGCRKVGEIWSEPDINGKSVNDFLEFNTNKKLGTGPTLCHISHMSSSLAAVLQPVRQSSHCYRESKALRQF